MIIIVGPRDEASHRAAEALGIDADLILAQRGCDYLLIDVNEESIDIVAADREEAARLLVHMLANGCPPESILPPPLEVSQIAWRSRH